MESYEGDEYVGMTQTVTRPRPRERAALVPENREQQQPVLPAVIGDVKKRIGCLL